MTASPPARTSRPRHGDRPPRRRRADRLGEAAGHDRRDAGEAEEADEQDRDQDRRAVRPRRGRSGAARIRASSDERRADEHAGQHEGRGEPRARTARGGSPRGRRPPRPPGRISDSIGTPARSGGRIRVGQHLERAEEHRHRAAGPRRARRPAARAAATARRSSTAASARSRGPVRSSIAGMVRETGSWSRRPSARLRPATQASRSARERVFSTFAGSTQARRAWLTPQRDVVELAGVVGVRVDRQQAAVGDRPAGPLDRQVEPVRRAVHLERRAGARGLGVDRVPVEVEVVAGADHPARRVGDDVDVRVPDRVERPLRQLGPRLAAGDVERRDDQVEASRAGRPRSRAGRRRGSRARSRGGGGSPRAASRAGAVPAASSAANRSLSAAMISRCSRDPLRA